MVLGRSLHKWLQLTGQLKTTELDFLSSTGQASEIKVLAGPRPPKTLLWGSLLCEGPGSHLGCSFTNRRGGRVTMSALMAPLCVGTPDPRLLAPGLAPLVEGPGSCPAALQLVPCRVSLASWRQTKEICQTCRGRDSSKAGEVAARACPEIPTRE